MPIFKLFLIFHLFVFSLLSFANDKENGGNVFELGPEGEGYLFFDFLEHGNQFNPRELEAFELIDEQFGKLSKKIPFTIENLYWLIDRVNWQFVDPDLKTVNSTGKQTLVIAYQKRQVALADTDRLTVQINRPIWNELSKVEQAYLLLHETLWMVQKSTLLFDKLKRRDYSIYTGGKNRYSGEVVKPEKYATGQRINLDYIRKYILFDSITSSRIRFKTGYLMGEKIIERDNLETILIFLEQNSGRVRERFYSNKELEGNLSDSEGLIRVREGLWSIRNISSIEKRFASLSGYVSGRYRKYYWYSDQDTPLLRLVKIDQGMIENKETSSKALADWYFSQLRDDFEASQKVSNETISSLESKWQCAERSIFLSEEELKKQSAWTLKKISSANSFGAKITSYQFESAEEKGSFKESEKEVVAASSQMVMRQLDDETLIMEKQYNPNLEEMFFGTDPVAQVFGDQALAHSYLQCRLQKSQPFDFVVSLPRDSWLKCDKKKEALWQLGLAKANKTFEGTAYSKIEVTEEKYEKIKGTNGSKSSCTLRLKGNAHYNPKS